MGQIEWFSYFLDAGNASRINVQISIGAEFCLDSTIIVLLVAKTGASAA